MPNTNKANKPKNKVIAAVIAVIIIIAILIIVFFAIFRDQRKNFDPIATLNGQDPGYNFEELQKTYPDIFAWIIVPGTPIDTPMVQSPTDDFYYLNHNAKQEFDYAGAAYIQMKNHRDLQDPVTVCYGHNMIDDRIFSKELNFADPGFFNANPEFYVYIPGHKYTYTIASAYVYDNKHILNAYDFSKKDVRMEYFDYVMHPRSLSQNVREGVTLDENSKLLQLSTCMNDLSLTNQRYILTGVLTKDEETK